MTDLTLHVWVQTALAGHNTLDSTWPEFAATWGWNIEEIQYQQRWPYHKLWTPFLWKHNTPGCHLPQQHVMLEGRRQQGSGLVPVLVSTSYLLSTRQTSALCFLTLHMRLSHRYIGLWYTNSLWEVDCRDSARLTLDGVFGGELGSVLHSVWSWGALGWPRSAPTLAELW